MDEREEKILNKDESTEYWMGFTFTLMRQFISLYSVIENMDKVNSDEIKRIVKAVTSNMGTINKRYKHILKDIKTITINNE